MTLRLEITHGPSQGQTLEFALGATVRIGRVVRGNDLTIKDSGISSKHLTIGSDLGKWVLRDLGSSNGTFINEIPVEPSVSVELRDGDRVKIGEETSISVKILEPEGFLLRRNPRRRGGGGGATDEESKASAEAEVAEEETAAAAATSRRRGRPRKTRVLRGEVAEEGSPEADRSPRNEEVAEEKLGKRVSARQIDRRLKKEEIARTRSVLGKIPENLELRAEEVKLPPRVARPRTLRGKNTQQKSVPVDIPEDIDSACNSQIDVSEDPTEDDNACGSGSIEGSAKACGSGSKEGVGKAGGSGSNEVSDMACGSGPKEDSDKIGGSEPKDGLNEEIDLEKMTLGEWFDFLEVDLPMQIIKESEEKIRAMRLKAQRVREYIEQQKGRVNVSAV